MQPAVARVAVVLAVLVAHCSGFLLPRSLGRILAARRADNPRVPDTTHLGDDDFGCDPSPQIPLEATLPASELIRYWGYPSETHTIQTEDGYILSLQRIPGTKLAGEAKERPAVLMQHGLLQSSDQWLLRGGGRDLAFIMADLGYDVWLGNFRGNRYSRRHTCRSPDSEKFWDFSWHENGYHDLRATVDHVLAVSRQPSLFYIGHSMGTTALMVLLAERPEYNPRIRVAVMMAPVAYFTHPRGVLGVSLPLFKQFERDLRHQHLEVFPLGILPLSLVNAFCNAKSPLYGVCVSLYFQVAGPDYRQLNSTLFPVLLSRLPAGASLSQFTHYAQVFRTGVLRQFDRGARLNMARYGQPQPPRYNLSNVVAPIAFYYSSGDYLAGVQDVERLIAEVPGTVSTYKIPLKEFNHGDYMWSIDSYELLYKNVVKLMWQY